MSVWGADSLPEEILMEVFDRLILLDDMFVFGAVCKSWRSVAKTRTPPAVPFLMLLQEEEKKGGGGGGVCGFYCLASNRIHRRSVPQTRGKKCLGVGFGWILTIGLDEKIELVHPLRRRQIDLPPPGSSLNRGPIRKVVASADPSYSPYIVMVIYEKSYYHLSYIKPGHYSWVSVRLPSPINFMDVIFYHNKFYAVTQGGHITIFHEDSDTDYDILYSTDLGTRSPSHVDEFSQKYLVESRTGELLLVCRSRDFEASDRKGEAMTNHFEVLRLEEEEEVVVGPPRLDNKPKKYEFVRVESLGDQALFLGNNTSFSVTAPPANGCKPNCIYFTHDEFQSGVKPIRSDTGIYNLGDGKIIERIPAVHSLSSFCPALWYV